MFDVLYEPDLAIGFIWVVALALFFFIKSFPHPQFSFRSRLVVFIVALAWLALQGIISYNNFFLDFTGIPPRLSIAVIPPLVFIVLLFIFRKNVLQNLSMKMLTWLHIVRIPIEIILLGLFLDKQIPQLMTFEGRNFDILAGLSAPFIAWFGFHKNLLNRKLILAWNIICLALLLNIVINAILSAPFAFQQFAFDQPNVAVAYFPFIWLPSFVVPLVLFSHLVCILQLHKQIKNK